MGTTADKLSYLNTTKAQIKESINLTNINITNEPFRYYAYAIKKGIINVLNDPKAIWNNFEKVTGEGTFIELTSTENAPIEIKLKGNTNQAGEPTPSTPVDIHIVSGDNEIKVCNKNLFDEVLEIGGLISVDGTNNDSITNAVRSKNYIPVKPNTTYTLSSVSNYTNFFWYYDKNKTGLSLVANNLSTNTFTTPANCYYIRFATYASQNVTDTTTKFQLELGSTATDYVEHQEYTKEINLPVENIYETPNTQTLNGVTLTKNNDGTTPIELCKIGTYQDYIYKTDRWYLHKEIGKTTDTIGSTGITINDMVSNGQIYSYYGGSVSGKTITYDSAISGTNTIYYQLATPTNTEITDSTLISQLEKTLYSYSGQTNISQTNNDLPFILDVKALKLIE